MIVRPIIKNIIRGSLFQIVSSGLFSLDYNLNDYSVDYSLVLIIPADYFSTDYSTDYNV